jgi:hypothetical protein
MEPPHYCTIEVPLQIILAVLWQIQPNGARHAGKAVACDFSPFEATGACQVETKPQLNDGPDYEGLPDGGTLAS